VNRRLVAAPALALVLASCGRGGPPLYPVYGKLTHKGQPAVGASVHFRRDGDAGPEGVVFPIGVADESGDFRLEMPDGSVGAPAGKYKVLVLWPEAATVAPPGKSAARPSKSAKGARPTVSSADRNGPQSVVDRLKYRYFSVERPLLEAEVQPQSNQLEPFDLKD
jgi:hypothetical protein